MDDKLRKLYQLLAAPAPGTGVLTSGSTVPSYADMVRGVGPDEFVKRYSDRGQLYGFLQDLYDKHPDFFAGTSVDRVLNSLSPQAEGLNKLREEADALAMPKPQAGPRDDMSRMLVEPPEMVQDQTAALVAPFDVTRRKEVMRSIVRQEQLPVESTTPMEEYAFQHPERLDIALRNAELTKKDFEEKWGKGENIDPYKLAYGLATSSGGTMTKEQILAAKSIPGIDDEGLLRVKRAVFDHNLIVAEQESLALQMRATRLNEMYAEQVPAEVDADLKVVQDYLTKREQGAKLTAQDTTKAQEAQKRLDALPDDLKKTIALIGNQSLRTQKAFKDLDARFPELKIINSLNADIQAKKNMSSAAAEETAAEWAAKGFTMAPLGLAVWRSMRGLAEIIPRAGEQLYSTYNAIAAIWDDGAKAEMIKRGRRDVMPGTYRDSSKDMRPPYESTAWIKDDKTGKEYELGFDRDGKVTQAYGLNGYPVTFLDNTFERLVQQAEDMELYKNHARTRINGSAMFNNTIDGLSDLAVTMGLAYATGNLANMGKLGQLVGATKFGRFLASGSGAAARVREALPMLFQYTGRIAEEGIAQGLSPEAAISSGVAGSVSEALIEGASPFVGKMVGPRKVNLRQSIQRIMADPKVLKSMKRGEFTELALLGTLGEVGEEVAAAYLQPITNRAINRLYDTDVLEERPATWQDYATAASLGATVAGLPGIIGGYNNARRISTDAFLKESVFNAVLHADKVPEVAAALDDPKASRINDIIQEVKVLNQDILDDKTIAPRKKVDLIAAAFDSVKAAYDAQDAKGTSSERAAADEAAQRQAELDAQREAAKAPPEDERPLRARVSPRPTGKITPTNWTGLRPGDAVQVREEDMTPDGPKLKDTLTPAVVAYVDPQGQYVHFEGQGEGSKGFRVYADGNAQIFMPEETEGEEGGEAAPGGTGVPAAGAAPASGRTFQARREDIQRRRREAIKAVAPGPGMGPRINEIHRQADAELAELEAEQKAAASGITGAAPTPEAPTGVGNLPIERLLRPDGSVGTQGVTTDSVRGILEGVLGIVVPAGATMREMVDLFLSDPKNVEKLRDFTRNNPIQVSYLPDGTVQINDGHHRAFLLNQAKEKTVPATTATQKAAPAAKAPETETDDQRRTRVAAIVSAGVKTGISEGTKKQNPTLDDEGKPAVEEEDFDAQDAEVELDRLEALAKRGKLSAKQFQSSYFGQRADTVTFKEARELIEADQVSFVKALRVAYEGKTSEKEETKKDTDGNKPAAPAAEKAPAPEPAGDTGRDGAPATPGQVPAAVPGRMPEGEAAPAKGKFKPGKVIFRRRNGRYEEYRITKVEDDAVYMERPDGTEIVELADDLQDFQEKAADTDTANERFVVDDTVVYTAPDGQEYEVNFRGYTTQGKAVIVGRREDGINQMEVNTSQLRGKPLDSPFLVEATPAGTEDLSPEQEKQVEAVETDDALSGIWGARRSLGKYIRDGIEYVRNKIFQGPAGNKGSVWFTDKLSVPFTYRLIEAEDLQPSHSDGKRNPYHFIPEAQPKPRNDQATIQAEDNFARNPRMPNLGANENAYAGAPIVNSRGEVIQGNNRSAGLRKGYAWGVKIYKEALADVAEQFGFTREQVEGMKAPILVREVNLTDSAAIEFGNYDVKDTETGAARALDPVAVSRRMPFSVKGQILDLLFSDPSITFTEALRKSTRQFVDMIRPYVTAAHIDTMLKDGNFTPQAVKNIEDLIKYFLFADGHTELPQLFEALPNVQRQGIVKAMRYIFSGDIAKSLVPQLQGAIVALNQFYASGMGFDEWTTQADMFAGGKTPREVYTPVELALARALDQAKTQDAVVKPFRDYALATRDMPGDMFQAARPGLSKKEAINQVFNVDYDETVERAVAQKRAAEVDGGAPDTVRPELPAESPQPKKRGRPSRAAQDQAQAAPAAPGAPQVTPTPPPAPKPAVPAEQKPMPVDLRAKLQGILQDNFNMNPTQALVAARVIDLLFRTMAQRSGVPLQAVYDSISFVKGSLIDAEMLANAAGREPEAVIKMAGAQWVQGSQKIIYAFTRANITTAIHEVVHVFEDFLTDEERQIILKNIGLTQWSVAASESFARGFERYLTEGLAPVPELQPLFDKLRQFFIDVYTTLFPMEDIIGGISPEMRQLYARMLGYDVPPSAGRELVETPPVSDAKSVADFLFGDGPQPLFQEPGSGVNENRERVGEQAVIAGTHELVAFDGIRQDTVDHVPTQVRATYAAYKQIKPHAWALDSRFNSLMAYYERYVLPHVDALQDVNKALEIPEAEWGRTWDAVRYFKGGILGQYGASVYNIWRDRGTPYIRSLFDNLNSDKDGTRSIKRLYPAEEEGRRTGGKSHVELSALLQGSARTNAAAQRSAADTASHPRSGNPAYITSFRESIAARNREAEEALITEYADTKGILYNSVEQAFDKLGVTGKLRSGYESIVGYNESTGAVYKAHVNNIHQSNSYGEERTSWIRLLDRIALTNHYFPEVPTEVVGVISDRFARSEYSVYGPVVRLVLKQPFIRSEYSPESRFMEYVNADMKARGFEVKFDEDIESYYYVNAKDGVVVGDVHHDNVIFDKDKKPYYIDIMARIMDKESDNLSRPRKVSLVPSEFEQQVAQDAGYTFPDILGADVMPDERRVLFQDPGSGLRDRNRKDPAEQRFDVVSKQAYMDLVREAGVLSIDTTNNMAPAAAMFKLLKPYIDALPPGNFLRRQVEKYPSTFKAGTWGWIKTIEDQILREHTRKQLDAMKPMVDGMLAEFRNNIQEYTAERLSPWEENSRKGLGILAQQATLLFNAIERRIPNPMAVSPTGYPLLNSPEAVHMAVDGEISKFEEQAMMDMGQHFMPRHQVESDAGRQLTGGAESEVFYSDRSGLVTKISDPVMLYDGYPNGFAWASKLDRLAMHNHYFPETRYILRGITEGPGIKPRLVLVQPFIKATQDQLTHAQKRAILDADMAKRGFRKVNTYTYENAGAVVADLKDGNFIIDDERNVFYIDPYILPNIAGLSGGTTGNRVITREESADEAKLLAQLPTASRPLFQIPGDKEPAMDPMILMRVPTSELRDPKRNALVYVSPSKILARHGQDAPDFDVRDKKNQIGNRVERAKNFIRTYAEDQTPVNPATGERLSKLGTITFEPSIASLTRGKVGFTDGRHRILAAQELGLAAVPLEVPKDQAPYFVKEFAPEGVEQQVKVKKREPKVTQVYPMPDVVKGFYSPIEERVLRTGIEKQSVRKWMNVIGSGDEAQFTGVLDWLKEQTPTKTLSKDEVLKWLKDNRLNINVIEYGGVTDEDVEAIEREFYDAGYRLVYDMYNYSGVTVYQQTPVYRRYEDGVYVDYDEPVDDYEEYDIEEEVVDIDELPGYLRDLVEKLERGKTEFERYRTEGESTSYKEILVTYKPSPSIYKVKDDGVYTVTESNRENRPGQADQIRDVQVFRNGELYFSADRTYISDERAIESARAQWRLEQGDRLRFETTFDKSHWSQDNVIVHVRTSMRKLDDGRSALFVEEVQSDWGEQGRDIGFMGDTPDRVVSKDEYDAAVAHLRKVDPDFQNLFEVYSYALAPTVTGRIPDERTTWYLSPTFRVFIESSVEDRKDAVLREWERRYNLDVGWGNRPPMSDTDKEARKFKDTARLLKDAETFVDLKKATEANETKIIFEGKKKTDKLPKGPFVRNTNAWTKLGMKVAMQQAVKSGADVLVWGSGEEIAEALNVSKAIDRAVVKSDEDPKVFEFFWAKGGDFMLVVGADGIVQDKQGGSVSLDNTDNILTAAVGRPLSEVVGKDLADRLMQAPMDEEFRLGEMRLGEGPMVAFYGSAYAEQLGIVGETAQALFKQVPKVATIPQYSGEYQLENKRTGFTSQTYRTRAEAENARARYESRNDLEVVENIAPKAIKAYGVEVTPEMKDQVRDGLPLFQIPGESADAPRLAPNGKPSNLSPYLYDRVRTPAFKNWFGDWEKDPQNASKVVDENGEPLLVFHHGNFGNPEDPDSQVPRGPVHFGTLQAALDRAIQKDKDDLYRSVVAFYDDDTQRWHWENAEDDSISQDAAGWGTEEEAMAAGQRATLEQIQGRTETEEFDRDLYNDSGELDLAKYAAEYGFMFSGFLNIRNPNMQFDAIDDAQWAATVQTSINKGYDGIFYRNAIEDKGSRSYVTFSPMQVKSGELNSGEYATESPNVLFQIIGEKGAASLDAMEEVTYRMENLEQARKMEASGIGRRRIHMATGWSRGIDGKWRYEIDDWLQGNLKDPPVLEKYMDYMRRRFETVFRGFKYEDMIDWSANDSNSLFTELATPAMREFIEDSASRYDLSNKGRPLPELWEHRQLYKAYPELKDVWVSMENTGRDKTTLGSFAVRGINGGEIKLTYNITNNIELTSTLVHEIQHAIQKLEGFTWGTSPRHMQNTQSVVKMRRRLVDLELIMQAYFGDFEAEEYVKAKAEHERIKFALKDEPMTLYRRTAGEIEARNASARMFFSPEKRKTVTLAATEDIQRDHQILAEEVKFQFDSATPLFQVPGEGVRKPLAPNGQLSNLTPEQHAQVRTPEFKKWFGDWENDPANASKAVDENGEPKVMYHGTAADFDVFDNARTGQNDEGLWGKGHYFTTSLENANSYALRQGEGAAIMPAFVSIKNPLVLMTGSDRVTRLPDGADVRSLVGPNLDGKRIKEIARAGKHDGVIQYIPSGKIGDVVVYDATQINSATANRGTYAPTNPNILFQEPGSGRKPGKRGQQLSLFDVPKEVEITNGKGEKEKVKYTTRSNKPLKDTSKDFRHLRHVWDTDRNLSFNGSVTVRDHRDVAHLMRILEDSAVEHAFAVHVGEDGSSHIQWLHTGTTASTHNDPRIALAGVAQFGTKEIYVVHNHPSGNLTPSDADRKNMRAYYQAFAPLGVKVHYMIMDTYHEQYKVMFPNTGEELTLPRARDLAPGEKLTTHSVMRFEALTIPTKEIRDSRDIANFIYGLRFSALPKAGMLVLNNNLAIIGNYIFTDGIDVKEAAMEFALHATAMAVVFYGRGGLNDPEMRTAGRALEQLRSMGVRVLDYVKLNSLHQGVTDAYQSFADDGILDRIAEPEQHYPVANNGPVVQYAVDPKLNSFYLRLAERGDLMRHPWDRSVYVYKNKATINLSAFNTGSRPEINLQTIQTLDPGKGYGREVMQDIIDTADDLGFKLILDASPFGTNDKYLKVKPLVEFYKKFGFIVDLDGYGGEFKTEKAMVAYASRLRGEGVPMYRPAKDGPHHTTKKLITPDQVKVRAIKDKDIDMITHHEVLLNGEVIGRMMFDRSMANQWLELDEGLSVVRQGTWGLDGIGWNKAEAVQHFVDKYNRSVPLFQDPGATPTKQTILQRLRQVAAQIVAKGMRGEDIYAAKPQEMAAAGVTVDDINAVLAGQLQPEREAPIEQVANPAQTPVASDIASYQMRTSDEVNKMQSGDTWQDIFGERPEGDQMYFVSKLNDMLQDGRNMIAMAASRWGQSVLEYGPPLFDMVRQMSDAPETGPKKVVLLATLLGELQEAKMRSPQQALEISRLQNRVMAYYQYYMNAQGKRVAAGRILRLYRDKYMADIYEEFILTDQERRAAKAALKALNDPLRDTGAGREEITPEEKARRDQEAAARSEADAKVKSKKKKSSKTEAKRDAQSTANRILDRTGLNNMGEFFNKLSAKSKNINCP